LIEINGEPCVLAVSADITDLKRAEATLRESEERFRLVANTAPVMIRMSGVDKLCTYFNRPWLEFTGQPLDAEMGNGWAEDIHPDDLRQCLDTYTKAFDRREPYQMEYRLRRRDGEYRWIFDSAVPRFSADGSFVGYIGSAIDITERKLAEEAVSMLSRRLIEAHEEERTWIARELHDDLAQSLAMLRIDLLWIKDRGIGAEAAVRSKLEAMQKLLDESVTATRRIAADLRPLILDDLGLVAAVEWLTQRFAERSGTACAVTISPQDLELDEPYATAVFRILQEALSNVARHAKASRVDVEIARSDSEVRVRVQDDGCGFEAALPRKTNSFGLVGLRERSHLVDGVLEIASATGRGTLIEVRIPLPDDLG